MRSCRSGERPDGLRDAPLRRPRRGEHVEQERAFIEATRDTLRALSTGEPRKGAFVRTDYTPERPPV